MSKIKVLYWEEIEDGTLEDLINEMGENFESFQEKQTDIIKRIKERASEWQERKQAE